MKLLKGFAKILKESHIVRTLGQKKILTKTEVAFIVIITKWKYNTMIHVSIIRNKTKQLNSINKNLNSHETG